MCRCGSDAALGGGRTVKLLQKRSKRRVIVRPRERKRGSGPAGPELPHKLGPGPTICAVHTARLAKAGKLAERGRLCAQSPGGGSGVRPAGAHRPVGCPGRRRSGPEGPELPHKLGPGPTICAVYTARLAKAGKLAERGRLCAQSPGWGRTSSPPPTTGPQAPTGRQPPHARQPPQPASPHSPPAPTGRQPPQPAAAVGNAA
jgi:hypothetical protein